MFSFSSSCRALRRLPLGIGGAPTSRERGQGAGDTLKQFHASSSCLKSMCTGVTAAGIEDCRKACGGHGFLQSSGIPEHLGTYLQACTVEGENHMLTQQVTRATTVRERPGCIPGFSIIWICILMVKRIPLLALRSSRTAVSLWSVGFAS